MSKITLTDRPPGVKPQPPHPILSMIRTIEHACANWDRLATVRLLDLCRTREGHEAANAA